MAGYTIPTHVAFTEGEDTLDTNDTLLSPNTATDTKLEITLLPPPSDEEPDTIEIPSSAKRLIFSL